MKVVQINATCNAGSTGKICVAISQTLLDTHFDSFILFSSGHSDYPLGIKYMSDIEVKIGALEARVNGNYGFNSSRGTRRLVASLERIKPDIVHLHNVHAHNCNLDILFNYLIDKDIKTVWTFHDCWAFTAHCPFFTHPLCEKWKLNCRDCPKKREFSWFFDSSERLFNRKKELLLRKEFAIVTPSKWLADLVRMSFLKDNSVRVINNGIDLNIFHPIASDFRARYNIGQDQKIVLGVAYDWGERKGLDIFIELAKSLPNDYKIVLVGTNDKVDQLLPESIISIHRTQNQSELASIYSAADVFFNPTREDNYPTVNMEAIACGTPVISFNTGGSAEMLDNSCGVVIHNKNIKDIVSIIRRAVEFHQGEKGHELSREACLRKAIEFDQRRCFQEYLQLYEELVRSE